MSAPNALRKPKSASNCEVFSAKSFDREHYLRRTLRNHFWIGGEINQMRLRDLTVGVAGLGGMGSHIAEHLVRLGVGRIKIADPDTIEVTNLNRQAIAFSRTVGVTKAEASLRELRGIAEDFELHVYRDGITEETAEEFVAGCDLIVDEIDVAPIGAHVLLHRAARKKGIPLYSSYSVGMGIHFYKFHGEEYTFEDFLGPNRENWERPTAAFLIQLFGMPAPEYLKNGGMEAFQREIEGGSTPILGPSCLLGHSTVVMRILLDQFGDSLRQAWGGNTIRETPVMPEFLKLDLADLSLRVARAPTKSRKE